MLAGNASMVSHTCIVLLLACLISVGSSARLPTARDDIEEDAGLSTIELIEKYGYPAEVHHVRTYDGYILEMHRIPYGKKSPAAPDKPVVFLQHGLLCSSADWVIMGTEKGLAYILADAGYDVWMGNSRGNTYSRVHAVYNPDTDEIFWNFTWHEMGWYDITAEIDYVLTLVGQPNLFYIGHSQGTTQFYVMASERPEYNAKIRAMFSLAPIAFMNHLDNIFLQLLANANDSIGILLNMMGVYEFLPNSEFMSMIGYEKCRDEVATQIICENVLFLIAGYDSDQLNSTMIPVVMGHSPAGASTMQMIHYAQEVNSADFEQYGGLDMIGGVFAEDYDLSKISCPVALHFSENDWLSHPTDVDRLYTQIQDPIGKFLVPWPRFNHLDYLWAIDVKTLLYDKVLSLMTRY